MNTFPDVDSDGTQFQRELEAKHQALRDLDIQFIKVWTGCESSEAALIIAHKVRFETTALEPQLRHDSRAWLESQGCSRFKNEPWPSEGELPT